MRTDIFEALAQLEKEKGISKDILIDTLESALIKAYKKNCGSNQNVRVHIDPTSGQFQVFSQKNIVEVVENDEIEISLDEAKKINPNYNDGDILEQEVTPSDFGRIAAQTAKQVIVQRLREAERDMIYTEYKNREHEVVNGRVQRFSRGMIFINLGKTEANLIPSDQIPTEKYVQGQRLKTYIIDVRTTTKGPQIIVSRTHPGLVKRLFEMEVPEIYNGEVEIKSVSREAGSRTKIAVYSPDEDIDPVGSCVGQKGVRVQSVVNELGGEKIDIIEWSENPKIYISNSLSPSKVEEVIINESDHSALVVVPDYQLSLAIGKEGQNARLAAKLTGWKIDIKSSTQYEEFLDEIDAMSESDISLEEAIDSANNENVDAVEELEELDEVEAEAETELETYDEAEIETDDEEDVEDEEE